MPAANHAFSIEQGSDFQITFRYFDENNIRANLTNWYVLFKFVTDTGEIYSFDNITKTTDYSLIAYPNGEIVLNLPARITNGYSFATSNYDLDLQEPNEQYPGSGLKRYRLSQGIITIIKRNTIIPAFDIKEPINGQVIDVCEINCSSFDSSIYTGPRIYIQDNTNNSSSINITDNRVIDTVEVGINGLNHNSPQDLTMFLAPPSGDKILLYAHNKITNYVPGFSFMFSDNASPGTSINNVGNGGKCKIIDRTNSIRFNTGSVSNDSLLSSFSHLHNYIPISGDWTLHIADNDIGVSGVIDNWKLIITYQEQE
jgi:subtilisin-like proprotein convertase family protein